MTNLDKAIKALEQARAQFHSYSEQHKAKGTEDGDAKALTNAADAFMCAETISDLSYNKLEPGDVEWACDSLELRRKVAWAARGAEAEAHNARIDRLLSALGQGAT